MLFRSTREEIRRIQRATGITTVFVTHDQEEALSISDLIVVMKEGAIQQIGKPQQVYDSPANLFVAKFLGTPPINIFEGSVSGGWLYIGKDKVMSVNNVPDGKVTVGVRPEGFVLSENGGLTMQLEAVEVMGRDITMVCNSDACEADVRVIISSENADRASEGEVHFSLRKEKTFIFDPQSGERICYDAE